MSAKSRRRTMSVNEHETALPSGRGTPWRPMIRAILAIGLIGGGLPALGQSPTVFDETRILHSSPGSACGDALKCKTFKGGRQKLEAGHNEVLTFQCPDEAPYFAGWDTEQNEHIRATMLPQPLLDSGAVPSGPDIRLIILAENVGTRPGQITVFLGCSTKATLPTRMRHQISGVPSNRATLNGGN
jgi:hypothetical protein